VAAPRVAVWLEGRKLRGGYGLERIGGRDEGKWVVGKMPEESEASPSLEPESP
jgi:hypothetical protein